MAVARIAGRTGDRNPCGFCRHGLRHHHVPIDVQLVLSYIVWPGEALIRVRSTRRCDDASSLPRVTKGSGATGVRTRRADAASVTIPTRVAIRIPTRGAEWAVQDSNLRPPACKAGALPAELTAPAAHRITQTLHSTGLGSNALKQR